MVKPVKLFDSVVGVCNNLGIGKNNGIPWPRIDGDMAFMYKHTSTPTVEGKQNAILMGKNTWFSIPSKIRPLKKRINVVLSRTLTECPEGAHYLVHSLTEAHQLLTTGPLSDTVDKLWILGGAGVYKEVLSSPLCGRLYVTRILADFDCDTFYPGIPDNFNMVTVPDITTEVQEEKGIKYKFEIYEMKTP